MELALALDVNPDIPIAIAILLDIDCASILFELQCIVIRPCPFLLCFTGLVGGLLRNAVQWDSEVGHFTLLLKSMGETQYFLYCQIGQRRNITNEYGMEQGTAIYKNLRLDTLV